MAKSFKEFVGEFFSAAKSGDAAFIRNVYQEWAEKCGYGENMDRLLPQIISQLGQLPPGKLENAESFDDFDLAHLKLDDGSDVTMVFRRKGGSWFFFNERSGYADFKKAYAIQYGAEGGRLRVLFNGKRSPFLYEIPEGAQGVLSLINSAIKPGENALTLESPDGVPVKASIRISGAEKDGIIDSSQGDVLSFDGVVAKQVMLKFEAK
ncbi:hypothetical protein L0Y65_05730 [Candidatus Micrarchaeota archaeon]|nr:hypothetical protein [Candidatus Micrarchaeota archaeon]